MKQHLLSIVILLSAFAGAVHSQQAALARRVDFVVAGHRAFVIEPSELPRGKSVPWVWYAPTLGRYPGAEESWMFERFQKAGIAIAGIDVGESFGNEEGATTYQHLYNELTGNRGYSQKPVLLARSRGGLMLYNWAVDHPRCVGGIAGIYPVCNLESYPGLERAADAFGLTIETLRTQLPQHNPIERLAGLADAKVPIFHIHGDQDQVVPLQENSAELARRYQGLGGKINVEVIKGQGHNLWKGWFQSESLTKFVIQHARGETRQETDKPNVVVIISDDQAWTDYGFMDHPHIRTPHLDQLASRSLLFERGYVAAPLCRPSLASMLTGRFPFEHGITGNDVDGNKNRAKLDIPLRSAFRQHATFVRALTSAGYLSHQSGKWWEGSWNDGGFTHGMTHGDPQRGGRHGDDGLSIGRNSLQPVTDFIDMAATKEKPFLVWYAPFLPHTPHNPPKRILDHYKNNGKFADDVAKYYAMCEWFDETCGQLLDHLNTKQLLENTVVIYLCDNGWAAKSTNSADPNQENWNGYALRSKSTPYENGIRTPIMVSWPGRIPAERTSSFAHAIDVFPTIAALTGVSIPADLTGINLTNSVARSERNRVFGVCHSVHNMTVGNPDDTLQYLWCIEDEHKLLVRFDGKDTTKYRNIHIWDKEPVRLYNLELDPHELNDISVDHPQIVQRMRAEIRKWRSEFN